MEETRPLFDGLDDGPALPGRRRRERFPRRRGRLLGTLRQPRQTPTRIRKRVALELDVKILRELERRARALRWSLSALMAHGLMTWVGNLSGEKVEPPKKHVPEKGAKMKSKPKAKKKPAKKATPKKKRKPSAKVPKAPARPDPAAETPPAVPPVEGPATGEAPAEAPARGEEAPAGDPAQADEDAAPEGRG